MEEMEGSKKSQETIDTRWEKGKRRGRNSKGTCQISHGEMVRA
jgi:hypothetical protein